ncbi:MAG: prepilin-type N-terminal cleavage/methylation domain-containing protein [Lentisphaeria bacterium]|nr:prepilin-type N-terminal cleavage/methylation domain-containing protein [Lentisphaeria bacterium]
MKKGFTLIELLVVIAIIAILAGMLLPALGQVKERGKAVTCLNNLKNIGVAAVMYQGDYKGYMPSTNNGYLSWSCHESCKYKTMCPFIQFLHLYIPYDLVWRNDVNGYTFRPGHIAQCPSDTPRNNKYVTHNWSYGQNAFCDWRVATNTQMMRPERMHHPAQYFWTTEIWYSAADGQDLNFSNYVYPFKSNANYASKHIDFRHNNTVNVLFMDSHVESFKQDQLLGTGEKYILSQKP